MEQNNLVRLNSEDKTPKNVPSMLEIIQAKPFDIQKLSIVDYTNTVKSIEDIIVDTQIMISTSKEINDFQLKAAARLIINDYGHLSLEDLERCMHEGVKGAYGEIYRFDVNVVCTWLNKYSEEKKSVVSSLPVLTPEQAAVLKMVNESKIKEPATTQDIMSSTLIPPNIKEEMTKMFKKHGIKEPFKSKDKKADEYKWPESKDDFEKDCLEVFKEKWQDQGCKELVKNKKPYMYHDQIIFNPDNWLTYCYKLKLESRKNK